MALLLPEKYVGKKLQLVCAEGQVRSINARTLQNCWADKNDKYPTAETFFEECGHSGFYYLAIKVWAEQGIEPKDRLQAYSSNSFFVIFFNEKEERRTWGESFDFLVKLLIELNIPYAVLNGGSYPDLFERDILLEETPHD